MQSINHNFKTFHEQRPNPKPDVSQRVLVQTSKVPAAATMMENACPPANAGVV